jgi:MFS family permease
LVGDGVYIAANLWDYVDLQFLMETVSVSPVSAGRQDPLVVAAGLAVVFAGVTGEVIAFSVLSPALPQMADYFGGGDIGKGVAQYFLTMPGVGLIVGGLAAGTIVDRFGIRLVALAASLTIAVVGSAGLYLSDFSLLLVSRCILGFATACLAVTSLTFLAECYAADARARLVAYQVVWAGVIGIAAVFVGGLLVQYGGWRMAFLFYAPVGLFIFLCAWAATKHSASQVRATETPARGGSLIALLPLYSLIVLLNVILVMTSAQLPFLLLANGVLKPLHQAIVIGAAQPTQIGAALMFSFLIRKLGPRRVLILALGLMAGGLFIVGVSHGMFVASAGTSLLGAGIGIVAPYFPYQIMERTTERNRNRSFGLMATTIYIGISINPVVIGTLDRMMGLPFVYLLVASVLAAIAIANLVLGPRAESVGRA